MPTLFQEAQEVYVPITVVYFLPCSGPVVFAGTYEVTFDWDERKEIRQGTAIKIHRSARIGTFIEGGSCYDNFHHFLVWWSSGERDVLVVVV